MPYFLFARLVFCYRRIPIRSPALIIECSHCKTRYQYDDERFERKPSKKIRCARCKEIFEIYNPAFAESKPVQTKASDETVTRRPPVWIEEEKPEPERPVGKVPETGPIEQPLGLPPGQRLSVAIIEGPEAAKVFRIARPTVTLGRSNADIVLNDHESSREHAKIEVRGMSVFLHDLDSRNGTWVDGERIDQPVEIFNQTEFQIGGTTLMLIVTAGE